MVSPMTGSAAGGAVDGATDAHVGAAAADVLERIDVGVGGLRVLGQQRHGRQDLARLAVAALGDVLVDPRLLNGMEALAVGQALDGRDGAAGAVGDRHGARLERGAVQVAVAGQLRREQDAGNVAPSVNVDIVAELMVRVCSSFLVIPSHIVDLDDEDQLGDVARQFLVPMLEPKSD